MDIKVFEPDRQQNNGTSPCSRNNAGCSHLCLAAYNHRQYSCACPTGIKLLADNSNCATGNEEILLLAKRTDIRKISLDTPDYSDIVIPVTTPDDPSEFSSVAIDYDPVTGLVYWTDQFTGINRAYSNGSNFEVIISQEVDHPDGIAVDWVGRNLFWSDTGTDRIEVSMLDGSHRKILISRDLDEPRDLSLDPLNGRMYWSDWGKIPRIERAWMDGSHREAIVTEDIFWPNGIALDVAEQKIYWCDAKTDRIEMANVDGSDRKVIISQILPHPFGLSILGEYIYWTDWEENTVERANKITGENRRVLVGHLEGLMSVQATRTRPTASWHNECSSPNNNGGCSHLCLATPEGKKCACPNGYELAEVGGLECILPEAFLLYVHKGDIGRTSLTASSNNGYVLPIRDITDASAIDGDFHQGRIYWTDVEEKSISRSYVNGSGIETLVEFGLDFPDGIAVDWMAHNIYWTDKGLNRIEVARCDGSSRRVLLWDNLFIPASIALDPSKGMMYWSSWGETPLIEAANLDGSKRKVFVRDVGKANGLTVDFTTRRLYWTDLDKMSISYATLDIQGYVRTVVQTESSKLYSLTLHKDQIYWTDWTAGVIEKANKDDGLGRSIVQSNIADVMDILVFQDFGVGYNDAIAAGTNPCAIDNGGCSELCLFDGKLAQCTCSSHHEAVNGHCEGPQEFLLFGQKNKISRLVSNPSEVPDLVLPIQGARDIRSLSYDSVSQMIFWIDYGSKKHKDVNKISINRAYDNGTLVKKTRVVTATSEESVFMPYDIAIDSYNRLLFWNDEATNVINIQSLEGDHNAIGLLLTKDEDKPRAIDVHPLKSLLFWVNVENPVRIERSSIDGTLRKTLISTNLEVPTDICIDTRDDMLFWADIKLNRIERSDLDGNSRQVLVNDGVFSPLVILAVQDSHIYWAVRSSQTISRVNKYTGLEHKIVKTRVPHLSYMISVTPIMQHQQPNPCLNMEYQCSHMCLVDHDDHTSRCTCPLGTGLVLSADEQNCGAPPTCETTEFTCQSGTMSCIPLQWRCDGTAECTDHSDEVNCPECGSGKFRCRSGQCVDSTMICDGIQDCDDTSDELSCCPKEKFQCTVSKECIDVVKTCDGVNDCNDGSDESIPQCTTNEIAMPYDGGNGGSIAIIVVGTLVVLALICVAGVFFYRKKQKEAKDDMAGKDDGSRGEPAGTDVVHPLVNSHHHHTMPARSSGGNQSHQNQQPRAGSSNGQTYDRNQLTGASSSTASSRGHAVPHPSPTTTVAVMQRYQHHSMNSLPTRQRHRPRGPNPPYRHYRTINQPPPPTPASTDLNDELSEGNYAFSTGHMPHYPSAANSVVGYDSEYYSENPAFGRPHPPTPRSQYGMSDYGPEDEQQQMYHDDDTMYHHSSPLPDEDDSFFSGPPPSREPSPTPPDLPGSS